MTFIPGLSLCQSLHLVQVPPARLRLSLETQPRKLLQIPITSHNKCCYPHTVQGFCQIDPSIGNSTCLKDLLAAMCCWHITLNNLHSGIVQHSRPHP